MLERSLRISHLKLSFQSEKHEDEKEAIIAKYQAEINKVSIDKMKSNHEIDEIKKQLSWKDEEISSNHRREEKLISKLHVIQKHYEAIKKEILLLKEDNRILNAKVERARINFSEKEDGIIKYVPAEIAKVRRKKYQEFKVILEHDPVLQSINELNDVDPETLIEEIQKNEVKEAMVFLVPDFKDQNTQTEVISYQDMVVQTEVEFLCGESIGERYVKIIEEPKLELQIMDVINNEEDLSWAQDLFRQETLKHSESQQDFLVQFQQKIELVNGLITKMKTNITDNRNISENTALANSLYSSLCLAILKAKNDETALSQELEIEKSEVKKGSL